MATAVDADSLSDSSDDEVEEVDTEAFKKLEIQLAANPADYNTHVQVSVSNWPHTRFHQVL